jgi:hypothetical protein
MTIYTIDLTKLGSISRLPSAFEILLLCKYTSIKFLEFLSDSLTIMRLQDKQTITGHILAIQWYMDLMGDATPDREDAPYPMKIHYIHVERHIFSITKISQYVTLDTLYSVPPTVLLDIMLETIENSLTCTIPRMYSLPDQVIDEYLAKLRTIFSELFLMFPKTGSYTQPNIISAIMKVEFEDQKDEIRNYVS